MLSHRLMRNDILIIISYLMASLDGHRLVSRSLPSVNIINWKLCHNVFLRLAQGTPAAGCRRYTVRRYVVSGVFYGRYVCVCMCRGASCDEHEQSSQTFPRFITVIYHQARACFFLCAGVRRRGVSLVPAVMFNTDHSILYRIATGLPTSINRRDGRHTNRA